MDGLVLSPNLMDFDFFFGVESEFWGFRFFYCYRTVISLERGSDVRRFLLFSIWWNRQLIDLVFGFVVGCKSIGELILL